MSGGGDSTATTTAAATATATIEPEVTASTSRSHSPRAGAQGGVGVVATVVCWMVSLWLLLVPIRAQVMGFGWYWLESPLQLGWMVVAGAYLDLLYVLGLGTAFLLLLVLARGKMSRRIVRWTYALACVASLLFALANIQVVAMVGHPLTYSWLYYSGFLRSYDAQKALAAGLTWDVVLGAALCVTALLTLTWLARKCGELLKRFGARRRWALIVTPLLVAAYVAGSAYVMRDFHRPSMQNPVVVLASSMLERSDNRLFSVATSASTADYEVAARSPQPAALAVPEPQVRNVLLIVLESVGAQYLPAYGGDRPITPELDSLRKHSKLYRNIYAHAPATNKSLVSMLCSMYPWPTYRFLTQEYPQAAVVSLSDVLHDGGYRTAFVSAADLRFGDAEGFLSRHQFDVVQDHRTITGRSFRSSEAGHLDATSDAAVCRSLVKWIEGDVGRPFFATLWTNQTHYPYFAKDEVSSSSADVRTELMDRYLRSMGETDAAIGQLMRELKRLGLDESTLVVVVGDHGEAFGQHGRFGHGNTVRELEGKPGGFGHGTALYEENIHVPMLLINPKLFAGEEDGTVGGLVDVGPTVLDLLHLAVPGGWQGRSLMRPTDRQRVFFAAPWSGAVFGYRQGDRKYLFDAINNSYRVFDLASDPKEETDLSHKFSATEFGEVYQQLAAWVQYQERLVRSVAKDTTPAK